MSDGHGLAERFETERPRLRALAYRMLGALSGADDAVQEAWLRLSRTDSGEIDNLAGWLTVVVSRICLDMIRSRDARPEEPVGVRLPDPIVTRVDLDPEHQALLADAVGLALQVVLRELRPPERLAFVLHDMFDVPFDQIASIVGTSNPAARQLASRARRRVRDANVAPDPDLPRQRDVVDAFLAAAKGGDFQGLLAVLDPECVLRADAGPLSRTVRGGEDVAGQAIRFSSPAQEEEHVLVNGAAGVLVSQGGRVRSLTAFTVVDGRIVAMDILADPDRLERLAV
ncbi:MAG: sigma-70 family RNA polymerase sigma factor [Gemmatimonadetes bacterium]|nr:sigma-70 family RNA polymerase sigma factor [Gemmatimonadota bacterium]NIQ60255.1 sigma-70 family RNA polymerase sigma factor [Gemmatimonadota bacterium]NIU80470.1 sigma-70 family RNA polymerase sigma factor [Gammaproteobacteria bacterium]NIX48804.1 sigma-70 family RNA polymerase sigma factor [Gemmatimonadota bacterium]NIY13261.1 sigma-70 family RNA polymerase sigma factor [Gemmatimonadota bacterium]